MNKTIAGLAVVFAIGVGMTAFLLQQINGYGQLVSEVASITNSAANLAAVVTAPTSGLVGWWKLDEGSGATAVDSSGGGHTGTLVNSPTWTTGQIGGALQFTSTKRQYVGTPNSITPDNSGFTYSVWVKNANGPVLLRGSGDTTSAGWSVFLNSFGTGKYCVAIVTDGTQKNLCGNITAAPSQWANVAVTFTPGQSLNLYVNGVLDTTLTTPGTVLRDSGPTGFSFGVANDEGQYLTGTIDDVRVYNRPLSTSEVSTIYQAGTAAVVPVTPVAPVTTTKVPVGYLDAVTKGVATGWAVDPNVPGTSIPVAFYIGGPAATASSIGTGAIVSIGQVTANLPSPDVTAVFPTYTGNHRFSYTIPAQYQDGKPHTLFANGMSSTGSGTSTILTGSPMAFTWTSTTTTVTPTPTSTIPTPTPVTPTPAPISTNILTVNLNISGGTTTSSGFTLVVTGNGQTIFSGQAKMRRRLT